MGNINLVLPEETLRAMYAAIAPAPTDEEIKWEMQKDRNLNPHNDFHKPKLRERNEVIADLRFKFADTMLKRGEMQIDPHIGRP